MTIINSRATGREMRRTKNQLKHIHDNSHRDTQHKGQAKSLIHKPNTPLCTVVPRQNGPTGNRTPRITVPGFSGAAPRESNGKIEEKDQN